MITGDYHHTAVAVATTVGMVKPDSQVVVIDALHQESAHSWSPGQRPEAPSRLGSRTATKDGLFPLTLPQLSMEVKRGAVLGRRVSFQTPQVLQMSTSFITRSNKVVPASPGAAASLGIGLSGAALLDMQPSEAVLPDRQPIKTAWLDRLPSDTILSPKYRSPAASSISLQMPPEKLQFRRPTMRRSVSLSRLPSQVFIPMSSLLSDAAHDDSAINSMQQSRLPSMHPVAQFPFSDSGSIRQSFHRVTKDTDPLKLLSASENPLRGLTFTPARGRYHMDPHEALTAMSEGSMQCAVTGPALEYLLQLHDVSLLETVLRNAVVFSRMQVFSDAAWFCSLRKFVVQCQLLCPFADMHLHLYVCVCFRASLCASVCAFLPVA